MILRNYLFSKEFDIYQQYPNDIAKQFLNQITSNQLSADQIVIHRDGNLIYYAYIQRVSTNKVFGLCIVTGDICVNINKLYGLFHESIEQAAYKGVLFSFDSTGKICKQTENFSNDGAEVNEFFKDFNRIAERKPLWKSIGSIDYSVSKDSKIYLSLTDDSNDKIIEAIEHYHNIIITIENPLASSYSNIVKQLNLDKEELNSRIEHLSNKNDELLKKKKQYKAVVALFIVVIICCMGLLFFYKEVTGKTQHIQKLEKEINIKIDSLALQTSKISSLKQELYNVTRFTSSTGASMRNNDSSDSNWIMWVKANTRVKITSFYVKGGSSSNGEVVLAIYDSNDNLIATKTTNISSSEFRRVTLGDSWQLNQGAYYIRIKESNGKSLQYHSSNDKEYAQFTGGALEVTGCSSYSDRSNADSRNKHGYYQYFYNIQYEIIPEVSEFCDTNNLIIIQ